LLTVDTVAHRATPDIGQARPGPAQQQRPAQQHYSDPTDPSKPVGFETGNDPSRMSRTGISFSPAIHRQQGIVHGAADERRRGCCASLGCAGGRRRGPARGRPGCARTAGSPRRPAPPPASPIRSCCRPARAATSGLITESVNALTSVENANATTSPTATTITSPRMRKFLNPLEHDLAPCPIAPRKWGGMVGRRLRKPRQLKLLRD
jgi:hypothetical protein